MKRIQILLFLIVGLLLTSAGCKKGTKLEPAAEKPPQKTEEQAPQKEEPPQPIKESTISKGEIAFQIIHFDFDKYNLRSDAIAALNENAQVMLGNPSFKIRIEGHCDERGTVEYNLALGEKRALAARDYLIKMGVAPSRIEIISYGKERPSDLGTSEGAWAKNRRDEFKVISD